MDTLAKPATGTKFGKLTVIGSHGIKAMRLKCECGTIQYSRTFLLLEGKIDACRKCMGLRPVSGVRVDLSGRVFGRWTVLSREQADRKGGAKYLCRCECGTEHAVWGNHLIQGQSSGCMACNCVKRGSAHPNFSTVGDITGTWWQRVVRNRKASAKRCALEITIDRSHAWELFLAQDRKCRLTGLVLTISDDHQTNTASLDRIDSALGYVPGNVQWLHKHINMLKNTYDQDYFIHMCRLVAEHNPRT